MPDVAEPPCPAEGRADRIYAFCWGDMDQPAREQIALHVVECDSCWSEVRRLSAAVGALRHSTALPPLEPSPELFSMIGLAGRLDAPLGGHRWFVLVAGLLYGLLYSASVWTELSFAYDRFSPLIWALSPVAFVSMSSAVIAALWVAHRRVIARRDDALLWASAIVLGAVALALTAFALVLPDEPLISATIQTRTAYGGYAKNVAYYFVPLLLFIVPPFVTVLTLQRQLRLGRYQAVADLLTGQARAVWPRGVWFIRPWVLLLGMGVFAIVSYIGVNYLLDRLLPSPYASLFALAFQLRVGLWFVVALLALGWYGRALNDLKGEALALDALFSKEPLDRPHDAPRNHPGA